MNKSAFIFIAATFTFLLPFTGMAFSSDCPDAQESFTKEDFVQAENAARACIEASPDNEYNWYALSRALGFQKKFDKALKWADKAYEKNPADYDFATWRVRLISWSGDLDLAWTEAMKLPEKAFLDKDNNRLLADIAMWRKDYPEAIKRYNKFLLVWPGDAGAIKNRGVSYKESSQPKLAKQDFKQLCDMGDCKLYRQMQSEKARFKMVFQPRYWFADKKWEGTDAKDNPEAIEGYFLFDARVYDTLHLGLELDHRARKYGSETFTDQVAGLYANYSFDFGMILLGSVGMTINPDFSPSLYGIIEPGWGFDFGLELYLRYWRMQFEQYGVNVISVIYTIDPVSFYVRYYRGYDEDPVIDPSNSILGKFTYTILELVSLSIGAAYGDGADYLKIDDIKRKGYYLILGGIGWQINPLHSLALDYEYRDEASENDRVDITYFQHQFALSYTVRF